jgi:Flp pilus assembly protein TadG
MLSVRSLVSGYFRREDGNFAAVMALLLVPLLGALSMAVETSNWFLISRATQNAADSAALAAANNGTTTLKNGSVEYVSEGLANAASYGFANGSNNVTVSVATTTSTDPCPDGATTTCFKATVTKVVPIYLTSVVGFRGDTTIGTARAKTITSVAYAEPLNAISFPSCLTTVGSDANAPSSWPSALSGNGTPTASAPGCSISAVGASSSIDCTGNNGLGAVYGFSTGGFNASGNHACVTNATTGSSFTFCDPYAASGNASCTAGTAGYVSSATSGASGTPCVTTSVGNGANAVDQMTAITASCTYSTANGALQIHGALSPSTPMVIVVSGAGATVSFDSAVTSSTNNITWIFTGTAANPAEFSGSSSINITAPNKDCMCNLSGIAAYQSIAGSCTSAQCGHWYLNGSQTISVSGLLYMPYTDASFGGSVTELSPENCFISTFNAFQDNGTGLLLNEAGCKDAGLGTLPTVLRYRAALVK